MKRLSSVVLMALMLCGVFAAMAPTMMQAHQAAATSALTPASENAFGSTLASQGSTFQRVYENSSIILAYDRDTSGNVYFNNFNTATGTVTSGNVQLYAYQAAATVIPAANPTGSSTRVDVKAAQGVGGSAASIGNGAGITCITEKITSSAAIWNQKIDTINMQVKKTGAPTGTATFGIFSATCSALSSFGTLDVSTLGTSYTVKTFSLAANTNYLFSTDASPVYVGVSCAACTNTAGNSVDVNIAAADNFEGTANGIYTSFVGATPTDHTTNDLLFSWTLSQGAYLARDALTTGSSYWGTQLSQESGANIYGDFSQTDISVNNPSQIVSSSLYMGTAFNVPPKIDYYASNSSGVFSGSVVQTQNTPTDNLKAGYSMEQSPVSDDSGVGNTLTLNGGLASAAGGKYNNGIATDGTAKYASATEAGATILDQATGTAATAQMNNNVVLQIRAEHINKGSALIGKQVNSITLGLKKAASPVGNLNICVFDLATNCVYQFGTQAAASLTTSMAAYTFTNNNGAWSIRQGDYIGIACPSSICTSTNIVSVAISTTDVYDGTNTALANYGQSIAGAWDVDTTNDLGDVNANEDWKLVLTSNTALDPGTGSWSWGTWYKIASAPTNDSPIITQESNPKSTNSIGYNMQISSAGLVLCKVKDGTNQFAATSAATVTDNNYHYLVCVYDSTAHTLKVYIDLAQSGSTTSTVGLGTMTNSGSLVVGSLFQTTLNQNSGTGQNVVVGDGTTNIVAEHVTAGSALNGKVAHAMTLGLSVTTNVLTANTGSATTTSLQGSAVAVAVVEHIGGASALIGKNINSMTVQMGKVGSPAGTVFLCVLDTSNNCTFTFGSIVANTLTADQAVTKTVLGSYHTIVSGDRIGVSYTAGTVSNYVFVRDTSSDTVANAAIDTYTTSWQADGTGDMGTSIGPFTLDVFQQGTAQVCDFDSSGNCTTQFGTVDVTTLTSTLAAKTFTLAANTFRQFGTNSYIGIKFSTSDVPGTGINVIGTTTESYDGTNSALAKYTSSWQADTTTDLGGSAANQAFQLTLNLGVAGTLDDVRLYSKAISIADMTDASNLPGASGGYITTTFSTAQLAKFLQAKVNTWGTKQIWNLFEWQASTQKEILPGNSGQVQIANIESDGTLFAATKNSIDNLMIYKRLSATTLADQDVGNSGQVFSPGDSSFNLYTLTTTKNSIYGLGSKLSGAGGANYGTIVYSTITRAYGSYTETSTYTGTSGVPVGYSNAIQTSATLNTCATNSAIVCGEKITGSGALLGATINGLELSLGRNGAIGSDVVTVGIFDTSGNLKHTFGTFDMASSPSGSCAVFDFVGGPYTIQANDILGYKDAGASAFTKAACGSNTDNYDGANSICVQNNGACNGGANADIYLKVFQGSEKLLIKEGSPDTIYQVFETSGNLLRVEKTIAGGASSLLATTMATTNGQSFSTLQMAGGALIQTATNTYYLSYSDDSITTLYGSISPHSLYAQTFTVSSSANRAYNNQVYRYANSTWATGYNPNAGTGHIQTAVNTDYLPSISVLTAVTPSTGGLTFFDNPKLYYLPINDVYLDAPTSGGTTWTVHKSAYTHTVHLTPYTEKLGVAYVQDNSIYDNNVVRMLCDSPYKLSSQAWVQFRSNDTSSCSTVQILDTTAATIGRTLPYLDTRDIVWNGDYTNYNIHVTITTGTATDYADQILYLGKVVDRNTFDSTNDVQLRLLYGQCYELQTVKILDSSIVQDKTLCADDVIFKEAVLSIQLGFTFWNAPWSAFYNFNSTSNILTVTTHHLTPPYSYAIAIQNTTQKNIIGPTSYNSTGEVDQRTFNLTSYVAQKPFKLLVFRDDNVTFYNTWFDDAGGYLSFAKGDWAQYSFAGFGLLSFMPIVFAAMFTRNTKGMGAGVLAAFIAVLVWLGAIPLDPAVIGIIVVVAIIGLIAYRNTFSD